MEFSRLVVLINLIVFSKLILNQLLYIIEFCSFVVKGQCLPFETQDPFTSYSLDTTRKRCVLLQTPGYPNANYGSNINLRWKIEKSPSCSMISIFLLPWAPFNVTHSNPSSCNKSDFLVVKINNQAGSSSKICSVGEVSLVTDTVQDLIDANMVRFFGEPAGPMVVRFSSNEDGSEGVGFQAAVCGFGCGDEENPGTEEKLLDLYNGLLKAYMA